MRRCPQCRRDYYDESLIYCLDDGSALLDGPASGDETTAMLSEPGAVATGFRDSDVTRLQIHGTEAEPHKHLGGSTEKQSFFANRAAKPLIAVAVGSVLLVGVFLGYRYFGSGDKQIDSIAVMPFVNQSGNPDIEYLSDGMTEALMNSLDQVPDLNVKARSSVFRYKDKDVDVRTIGRELGVQAILNGRMVQRGDALTLFLELVDATTGDRIWGEQYDRKQSDLVSLHREIASDVSEKLRSKLSGDEANKIVKSDTANAEAYRLYMQGRFYWNKRRIGPMGNAIGYFQQAIDLDPNYAKAYAGLADAVAQPNDVVPFPERAEKARAALVKALSIDAELAEAHTALGHILLRFNADFAGAERELSVALKLDPKWIDTYQRYSELYSYLGKHDEALTKCREGLAIEPFNIPLNASCGVTLTYARRYDEAITQLKKTVEMAPDHRNAQYVFGHSVRPERHVRRTRKAPDRSFEIGRSERVGRGCSRRIRKSGLAGCPARGNCTV